MTAFSPHGQVAFRIEGRLLIVDIDGPWNLELIQAYHAMTRASVERLSEGGPWGVIIVIHHAALCPPDAIAAIRDGAMAQARFRGRAGTAYVIDPSVEGYRLMDPVWRGIYADAHPFNIFESMEDAMAWSLKVLDECSGGT